MTFDEKRMFREYDSFDMLRTIIGLKREFHYRGEYNDAKTKYNTLRDDPRGNQINALLDKSYTKWSSPEWGAPKGRRSNKEYDIFGKGNFYFIYVVTRKFRIFISKFTS